MNDPTPHRQRLVVELRSSVSDLLNRLCEREGLNKTVIVNRAVEVYGMIMDTQVAGGKILIQEAGSDEYQRIRIY